VAQSQSRKIVHETLSWKYPSQKGWWVAQGVGPEFKPQYCQKKRESESKTNFLTNKGVAF
jgi:hypothetical protein